MDTLAKERMFVSNITSAQRNSLLIYLVAGLTTTSHGSMELIYPLNLDQLSYSLPTIGGMVGLIGLGALAARLPGGIWYQQSHARWLTVSTLALAGISTVGLSLTAAWLPLASLAFIHGFAFGLATTFLLAVLIEIRSADENPAISMAWYTAAISSGYAIGAPLGALSIEHFGHQTAFVVSGVVSIVAAVLTVALQPMGRESSESVDTKGAHPANRAWRNLAGLSVVVWQAALLAFYINFVSDAMSAFFPIYALSLGISLGAVGLFKFTHSLAAAGIRFAAAGMFRFLDIGVTNHVSIIAMALGTVALSWLTDESMLLVVFIILGISRGLLRVTSATMIAQERKRSFINVGMASGVYNAGLDAGSMLGPPVAGILAGIISIPTTFRVVGLALPVLYYAIWVVQRVRVSGPPPLEPGK